MIIFELIMQLSVHIRMLLFELINIQMSVAYIFTEQKPKNNIRNSLKPTLFSTKFI